MFNFLLSKTTHIYARDFDSVKEIKAHGYQQVTFFMDTAYYAWQRDLETPHKLPGQKKYIIVNINKNGEKFIDEIIADIKYYDKAGYEIYYLPVSKGKNEEYNDKKYYSIVKNNADSKVSLLDWEADFGAMVRVIKGAEMVISTRLHLFLIASFMGVQTKVYPYQRKILKMQEVLKAEKIN